MRSTFDAQLDLLHKELITMGTLCENAIAMSAKALVEGDLTIARKAFDYVAGIGQKERDIESMCLRLLLQQQPVARDLRVISSALKMVTDMQRIGNNSGDIAEIVTMGNIAKTNDKSDIHDMALATIQMVTDSIDAFVKNDMALAKSVIAYDDVVDGYFDKVKEELLRRLGESEIDGEYTLDLLMIAKYFERIGDHATNIAEWVLFSILGRHADDNKKDW